MANIPINTDPSQTAAFDQRGLSSLKEKVKGNTPEAMREAAKQFEGLFINMMLKSMRNATPDSGLLNNQAQKTYTSMYDQQISQNLANRGIGLADMMVKQMMARQFKNTPDASNLSNTPQASISAIAPQDSPIAQQAQYLQKKAEYLKQQASLQASQNGPFANIGEKIKNFAQIVADGAAQASQILGIPANFITAQAALESGWGKHQIKNADGSTSYNLFGIKAGPSWQGKVAEVLTTEYVNGSPVKVMAKFRAYDSYADAFKDYASLLKNSPRYQDVINQGQTVAGFSQGLQKAGYATDPQYANKLASVIQTIEKA